MTMNLQPLRDLLIVEKIQEETQKIQSGIILPGSTDNMVLIKIKVLAVGPKVEDLKVGDIVYAENILEPLYKGNKNVGLMNQKYIHCIIKENDKPNN